MKPRPSFRPRLPSLAAAVLAVLPAASWAQTLVLRDGTSVPVTRLRREGQTVMNAVSAGEVGYPVANIARLDFPEPPQLAAAGELLAQGKAAEAGRELDPVVNFYAPLRDLPGNYWVPAARLKANALTELGRDPEAKALWTQLAAQTLDRPAADLARLRLVAGFPVPPGQEDKALAACDAILNAPNTASGGNAVPRDIDAEAWVLKGKLLLGRKEFQPALLAYLHLPTLYHDQRRLQPAALLGSGRAYLGLKDEDRARRAFADLQTDFPGTAENAAAKTELQALDNARKKAAAQGTKRG